MGETASWLVHFNVGSTFWFFNSEEKPHVWLVQSIE
jgi:hypothetical protein